MAHRRTGVRIGDYFVLADQLTSETDHTFDLYLHSEGKLSLDGGRQATQPVATPVPWIEKLSARMPVTEVSGRWAEGGSGIGFWLGGTGPVTPMIGQCPAETGSRKIQLLLGRQKGRVVDFVTELYPYKRKLDLAVERRGNEITIHLGASSDVLTLPADGTRPTVVRGN